MNTETIKTPCRDGLVVSVTTSHAVGCGFAARSGHTQDHDGIRTAPFFARRLYGRSLTVQPDCPRGRVVCGTVYRDMHFKDILGSIGYCITVPDFI